MGHWGVKSYENDDADEALDAGFDRVHGASYEELMDDRNPLSFDQIQERLANPATLAAALAALAEAAGVPFEEWDERDRLAYAGVVVRHAELGVAPPDDVRARALGWLEEEAIEWPEATLRRARRDREIRLLRGPSGPGPAG
jgi:hypothetical protein